MQVSLRASKFFVVFFGDNVSEKEFYAKDFSVEKTGFDTAIFSFQLMKLLDHSLFKNFQSEFDTLVIEDKFLINKLKLFLVENPEIKFFKISFSGKNKKTERIQKIKFNSNQVLFHF